MIMLKTDKNNNSFSGEPAVVSFLHAKAKQDGTAVSGTFELTSRCNFNCRMCYVHNSHQQLNENKELSADEWLRIAQDARQNGMVFLLLTGGEPLLRKDFSEIYLKLSEMGFIISLNTNASLIDDNIIRLFEKVPPSRVNVSLYGTQESTYKNLCGVECAEKVKENIKKLISIGIGTVINYSCTPFNSDDTENIIQFAKENGLNIRASSYMYPCIRCSGGCAGENEGRFSPADAAKFRIKFDRMYYGENDFLSRAENLAQAVADGKQPDIFSKDSVLCRAGTTSFWVDWQGNMSMCGMIPSEKRNILESGFEKCWNEIKNQTAKLKLYKGCTECKFRFFCNVCGAVCLAETGSFDKKPEYVCKMTEETYAQVLNALQKR